MNRPAFVFFFLCLTFSSVHSEENYGFLATTFTHKALHAQKKQKGGLAQSQNAIFFTLGMALRLFTFPIRLSYRIYLGPFLEDLVGERLITSTDADVINSELDTVREEIAALRKKLEMHYFFSLKPHQQLDYHQNHTQASRS